MKNSIINPGILARENYLNDSKLKIRKLITRRYVDQEIDLEGEGRTVLQLRGDERILDVGCGNADFLMYLRKRGHSGELVGIDISEGMFQEVQKNIETDEMNISLDIGDVQELQFPSASFDAVICKHVLHHVPNIHRAIREMHRVLKPARKILLMMNNADDRPRLRLFEQQVQKLIIPSSELRLTTDRFNSENSKKYLNSLFSDILVKEFATNIVLNDPNLFVMYFDSFRDFWYPSPTDAEWKQALEYVRSQLAEIIEKEGTFTDKRIIGVVCARKK